MGRRSGGPIIESWEHFRYKVKVIIRLNPDDSIFHGDYGDRRFTDPTLNGLRAKLNSAVEETMQLEWIPVLRVKCHAHFHGIRMERIGTGAYHGTEKSDPQLAKVDSAESELDLEFDRFWIAQRPDGSWMSCKTWDSVDDGADHYDPKKYPDHRTFGGPVLRRMNSSPRNPLPLGMGSSGHHNRLPKENY